MAASGVVYPAGVASVNGEVGDVLLDAADVDAPGAAAALTVSASATVVINRATMVDPETAEDLCQFAYEGQRTGYHNEYGEVRARPAKTSTVPLKVFQKSASQSANLLEVCDAAGGTLQVNGFGGLTATGRFICGSWTSLALEPNAADAGAPKYPAAARLLPDGNVQTRGQVNFSGSFSSGATFATLPAGHRPAADVSFTIRTGGTGAANTFLDVAATTGAMSIRTALGSGAQIYLDGHIFAVAAS